MLEHVYAALMPQNRLILRICADTGLRLSDVLCFITATFRQRFTLTESKTGKKKRVYIRRELFDEAKDQAGLYWVFEHRTDPKKHKTRQAVWADIKRAKKAFRIKENLAPHSLRKIYAVEKFRQSGDLAKVQELLNHSDPAVTAIYAFADILTKKKGAARAPKEKHGRSCSGTQCHE